MFRLSTPSSPLRNGIGVPDSWWLVSRHRLLRRDRKRPHRLYTECPWGGGGSAGSITRYGPTSPRVSSMISVIDFSSSETCATRSIDLSFVRKNTPGVANSCDTPDRISYPLDSPPCLVSHHANPFISGKLSHIPPPPLSHLRNSNTGGGGGKWESVNCLICYEPEISSWVVTQWL